VAELGTARVQIWTDGACSGNPGLVVPQPCADLVKRVRPWLFVVWRQLPGGEDAGKDLLALVGVAGQQMPVFGSPVAGQWHGRGPQPDHSPQVVTVDGGSHDVPQIAAQRDHLGVGVDRVERLVEFDDAGGEGFGRQAALAGGPAHPGGDRWAQSSPAVSSSSIVCGTYCSSR
jgi:hypothetical protein